MATYLAISYSLVYIIVRAIQAVELNCISFFCGGDDGHG